jgi:hypothetical protein
MGDGALDETGLNADGTSFDGDQDHGASPIAPPSSVSANQSDPLNGSNFTLDAGTHQVSFLPTVETEVPLMVPGAVLHDELDLSLTSSNLHEPVTMNDIWQMPSFV